MVKRNILILTVAMIGIVGCEEQFSPAQIQQWGQAVEALSETVDKYQDTTVGAINDLGEKGLVGREVAETVTKLGTEIDRLQPQILDIAKSIEKADLAGKDDLSQWLEVARAANAGSAPVNPYSGYIELGLGSAAALMAALAVSKNKLAKDTAAKRKAEQLALERTLKSAAVTGTSIEAELFDNVAAFREKLGVS